MGLAIYLTAVITGAHINPEVTLALAIYRGFSWAKLLPYFLAETMGTFTGATTI